MVKNQWGCNRQSHSYEEMAELADAADNFLMVHVLKLLSVYLTANDRRKMVKSATLQVRDLFSSLRKVAQLVEHQYWRLLVNIII